MRCVTSARCLPMERVWQRTRPRPFGCSAVRLFQVAAECGCASAQCSLGVMVAQGVGTEHDPFEAVRWFRRSADLGEASAQYNLGVMYMKGMGVAKDEREADRLFKLAADNCNATAPVCVDRVIDWFSKRNPETGNMTAK